MTQLHGITDKQQGWDKSWLSILNPMAQNKGVKQLTKNMESENNLIKLVGESTRSLRRSYGKT